MKRIIYVMAAILLFSLYSCEDWMDVNPKSEIKTSEIFQTEEGFRNALTGIYIGMTMPNSYGQFLTWHLLENLARQYDVSSGVYEDWQMYNFNEKVANNAIESIWLKQYNAIAEINKLLESIEEYGHILDPISRDIIKGEAVALRAFLHFDLLRLFGKGNLAQRNDVMSELTIPYVITHSKDVTKQKTYSETFALIEADINKALQLLESDPYYSKPIQRPDGYDDLVSDPFFSGTFTKGRETRMNYGAVKALKARIMMWKGDKTEALRAANESISDIEYYIAKGKRNWASNSWGVGYSYEAYRDQVFYFEQLFCLDVVKLGDYISGFYEKNRGSRGGYDRLVHEKSFADEIFAVESDEGLSDLRYLHQYEDIGSGEFLTIKVGKTLDNEYAYFNNVIPILKIPEVYLIAAECYASGETQNIGKAVEIMNLLKEKRNISDEYYLDSNISQEDLEAAIFQEYRKEFIQEGQLFYFYKRIGAETFPGLGSITMSDVQYVLPYPDVEIDLGQRVQ